MHGAGVQGQVPGVVSYHLFASVIGQGGEPSNIEFGVFVTMLVISGRALLYEKGALDCDGS